MKYLIIFIIFVFAGCVNTNQGEPDVDLYLVEDDIGITLVMENTGDGFAENIEVVWDENPVLAADGDITFDENVNLLSPNMNRRVFTKMRILCFVDSLGSKGWEPCVYTYPYTMHWDDGQEVDKISVNGAREIKCPLF